MGYDIELFRITGWFAKDLKWGLKGKYQKLDEWLWEAAAAFQFEYGADNGDNIADFRSRTLLPYLLKHFGATEPTVAITLNKTESKKLAKTLKTFLKKEEDKLSGKPDGEVTVEAVTQMIESLEGKAGKGHYVHIY